MKIAFATIGDTRDIKRGSGTPYYLWQELLRQGHTVHLVGPLNVTAPFPTRLFKFISTKSGKKYFSYRDPFMAKVLGGETSKMLQDLDYDVLLTNDYSIAGYCKTKKPVILFTDDIFPRDYSTNIHPWNTNLSRIGVVFCQITTKAGLRRATKCVFASHNAREESQKYHLPKNEFYSVIPYGANITSPDIFLLRNKKPITQKKNVDLLFIGKDWNLKGGDVAVKTARILNERGIPTQLHIVGVDLSGSVSDLFIKFYGLLNKDNDIEKKKFLDLLLTCDILIVPSKAEGYGLVFVEAAAYGIPSLSYRSTGVITAVQDGRSGILLEPSDNEMGFAKAIIELLQKPEKYNLLVEGSREFYKRSANWQVAVSNLISIMKNYL